MHPTFPTELLPGAGIDMAMAFHVIVTALLLSLAGIYMIFRLRRVPGRTQSAAEGLVVGLDWLLQKAAGPKAAHRYMPLVGTALVFIFLYHAQAALRVDVLTAGRYGFDGWAFAAEPLTVDRDGDGRYDSGDQYEDKNGNGHRDRGVVIPHPAATGYSVGVDVAVGVLLLIGVLNEVLRRGRLLPFLAEVMTLRWLMRAGHLLGEICSARGLPRPMFLPIMVLIAGLLAAFHANRAAFMATGLDIPLALIDAAARAGVVGTLTAALLGSAAGNERWAPAAAVEPVGEA